MPLFCVFTAMNWIGNELPFINICLSPRPQLRCRIPPEHVWCFWLVLRRHPAGKFYSWLPELQIWRKLTEIWGYVKDVNEESSVLHANEGIWERCKDCLTLNMEALFSLETSIGKAWRVESSGSKLLGRIIWWWDMRFWVTVSVLTYDLVDMWTFTGE